jgi:pimeloyl-ACP methyl ester carboxylesterase
MLNIDHSKPQTETDTVAVFLHGFASDQSGEKALYLRDRVLSTGVAYTKFDFRGHGKSDSTMRELTLSRMLEDCDEVVSPLIRQRERVVLIGSSMGACVAAWYAALNPGRIATCAMIAPAFNFVDSLLEQIGPDQAERWKEAGVMQFANHYCNVELGYDLVRDWEQYPIAELERQYLTPSLVIHGTEDEILSYQHSLNFTLKSQADVDLILVKGGDHRLTDHKEKLGDWITSHITRGRR